MKKKLTIILSMLLLLITTSITLPNSTISRTTTTIAKADLIPDNYYTDELGTFRVMVRVKKDNTKIRDNPFVWAKVLITTNKGELYNYRGNNFGYYTVSRGTEFGDHKSNYTGYIANANADVVKLYTNGRIVEE